MPNRTASDATAEIDNWASSAASSVVGVYNDATNWVEDAASSVGNSIKKGLSRLFG